METRTTIAFDKITRNITRQLRIKYLDNSNQNRSNLPSALDFFAGSGLATEGLKQHFNVVWANDNSTKKAVVYNSNHPSHLHVESIECIQGIEVPSTILSWASFPCQDLSLAGNIKGMHQHTRSGLVWEWLRVMDEMPERPPLVVAENVIGLLSANSGEHYTALHHALASRGYRVGAIVLNASHWLPQSRPRVFVVAVSNGIDISDCETDSPTWCQPSSVRNVAKIVDDWVWWKLPKPIPRSVTLDKLIETDAPFDDDDRTSHVLNLIPELHKQKIVGTPERMLYPGYRRIRHGRQVLELRFDGLAGCLRTPGGGSSRQVVVMRSKGTLKTRLLTVRETARLMGAPENYNIPGGYNDGYKAMGDAVAVPVVRYLAEHLLSRLASKLRPISL